ncbi:TPA: restriction endonuclease subunit S [Vibrio cholerae]|nr:restriction endonuclease subunit S [Vibrio cholerae]HDZ9219249.1 restriction endonuclease subunit S [Vibrio cholerae]
MANEFKSTTIGEQLTLQRGFDITKKEQSAGDIPVVSSGGISSYHNQAKVKGPGVVLGRKGSLGTVYFLDEDFWPHDTTLWVKDFKGNNPRFVYYFFKGMSGELKKMDVGAANPALNRNHVHPLIIEWPNKNLQDRIVSIAAALDNKIILNRQINQTLEQMAQTLFKSWFVDFDPVIDNALDAGNPIPDELQHRAEARKAVRESEGFKPLPDDVRQLFPDAFEESELGWVPKGWPIQTIKDIAVVTDFVANGSFAALKENVTLFDEPEHALYVRTTDFKSGFDSAKAKYVDKKSYEFLSKSKLLGDEVIISNVGDVGTVFRPPVWLDLPMTLGSNAISVSASELNNYLYFHFSSHKGQKSIDGIVSGSAQQKFNKTGFRALTLVTPDADVIEAFNNRYNPLMLKAISNERNIILMTKLRDTLLPKLISGELRLDDVELAVEQEAVSAEQQNER